MSANSQPIRPAQLVDLARAAAQSPAMGVKVKRARGQNFAVDWIEGGPQSTVALQARGETLLIAAGVEGASLRHAGADKVVGGRTIAIIPAGETTVTFEQGASLIRICGAADIEQGVLPINAEAYATRDAAVAAPGAASVAQVPGVRLFPIDTLKAPADKPRLKMLRSGDLSINWVEYQGLRDRKALSPHVHDDFEQGSLAITGTFLHHLRVPWGNDATQWQDDRHVEAPPASLMVIPPRVIHTTEGLGEGHHILVDIFCPPRADFLAKGWISNAADYQD